MKRAGFWRRFFAYLIDAVVIYILFAVFFPERQISREMLNKLANVSSLTNISQESLTNEISRILTTITGKVKNPDQLSYAEREKVKEEIWKALIDKKGAIGSWIQTLQSTVWVYTAYLSLFYLVYFLLEVFFARALGKLALSMTIVSKDGKPATKGQLFIRYLGKVGLASLCSFLSLFTGYWLLKVGRVISLIIFLGFFMVLGSSKQALHDKIAGTVVKVG